MNAVGIDVSKGKSTVAIMRPFGEVIAEPFEVSHTDTELRKLACFLEKLPGETRIVMEYTGSYWQPIAKVLHDAGFFVSAVNALLIYKYGNNSIRKGKTDKLDAVKIANYCLDRWTDLERYSPTDQIRQTLKTCRRQYDQYIRLKVNLKNNLIALLDGTFPGVNTLLKSAPRDTDGHEKWVDFAGKFWHRQCVCGNSEKAFANQYRKWCAKAGYRFNAEKAVAIYSHAGSQVDTLPMSSAIQSLITHAVAQLNMIIETISAIQHEMLTLASQLPEYPIVMRMFGVGPVLGPQLMAEIGDVRRFHCKQSLVAFAGVDAPPCQSGTFESKNRHISKRGSPRLRKTLFQVMSTIIQHAPADDPVYQFLDRKRREGKHYYVYMTAAANKFLRIYYGTVMAYFEKP
ncbi:IS110 family transposase [Flavonifractor sp. An100]|uniref:IS110 family transposase n=1 Tax=Flavonifractor sp. An100 TaxID=1965538 RepID=UPI000B398B43|nr:IS110 family transposase [Flavonifractor sp. An100]OUQ74474.1 IS110 family transposase [Flavonifractor sp. An100]